MQMPPGWAWARARRRVRAILVAAIAVAVVAGSPIAAAGPAAQAAPDGANTWGDPAWRALLPRPRAIGVATPPGVIEVGPAGWAGRSLASDATSGWGDHAWRIVLPEPRFLFVAVDDCCLPGDRFEVHVDGRLRATTPATEPPSRSRGSVGVALDAGEHLLRIRHAGAGGSAEGSAAILPAGFAVAISFAVPTTGTVADDDAMGTVAATRDGWGALVVATVSDRRDDDACAYLLITAALGDFPDGDDLKVTDCSPDGRPVRVIARLPASALGTRMEGLLVKLCRERRTRDCPVRPDLRLELAAQAPLRPADIDAMERLFALPLDDFLAQAGTGDYDWGNDGCSFPVEAAKPLSDLALRRFRTSCIRHD
ncbi:MAG: hypothetical protein ACKOTZ_12915, partial [Chloroflexota bacterium]